MELPKPSRRNTTVGAYVLGEEIGKGAHGQVYKAIDTRDGSMVAVKEIALRRLDDKARRALRLEIQLLTELGAHDRHRARGGWSTTRTCTSCWSSRRTARWRHW